MPCARKKKDKACNFELLALRPDLNKDDIHVYAYSQHSKHPFMSKGWRNLRSLTLKMQFKFHRAEKKIIKKTTKVFKKQLIKNLILKKY
jgi:hypothetical protein